MDDVKQETVETFETQSIRTAKIITKKKIIIFVMLAVLIVAVCIIVAISSSKLNEYEMLIYENCKTMQSKIKNPDSFILYDEVFIAKDKDRDVLFSFIKCGGTNSFGAIESGICVFADSYYWGTYDEVRNLANVYDGYGRAFAAYYEHQYYSESVRFEYIEINADVIRNKLGLK